MHFVLHHDFKKQLNKVPMKIRQQFYERLEIFMRDPHDPILNNHSVNTAYPGGRSINVSGDYRAIYKDCKDYAMFTDIGTHSSLYR